MKSAYMFRRLVIIFMALSLSLTSVACGSKSEDRSQATNQQSPTVSNNTSQKPIADGKYPVQQASYNDANGEYNLMLINTPAGTPPMYRTTNLQMARLTEEEVKAGEKNYLKSEKGQVSLHVTEDYKIEYVHNVTESKTNPQTGQKETVVVRQESSFWKPFAGAVAGNVAGSLISNMLFRPQYYMPPAYSQGGMNGYGGYGNNYGQAVQSYQSRYNSPPPAVTNRTTLRTTGRLNGGGFGSNNTNRTNPAKEGTRSTGSGFGSSNLNRSENGSRTVRPSGGSSRSFGSGRSRSGSGFGSGRRR
jgi:hypothetical protein